MEITINQVQEIVSALTSDEQQLLKDTINYGSWGDSDWEFLNDRGCVETVAMYGYCTNESWTFQRKKSIFNVPLYV